MKKFIATLLKQPWFYIIVAELLLLILFPLVDNPSWLYSFLSEAWYDAWEEFAALHMEGYLYVSTLFLFLFTICLIFCTAFSQEIQRERKTGLVILYLFLAFFAFGFLIPTLGKAREKAKRIHCSSNLKQIYLAFDQYALDYKSYLPPDLKTLSKADYLTCKSVYHCPSQSRPNSEFSDYLYYGAGRKLDENPPFLLLRDRDKNHPGKYCNLLMSDGQIIHRENRSEP